MSCDAASGWACKKQRERERNRERERESEGGEGRERVSEREGEGEGVCVPRRPWGGGIWRGRGTGESSMLRADRGRRENHAWGTPRVRAPVRCCARRSRARLQGRAGASDSQYNSGLLSRAAHECLGPPPTALTPRPPAAPYALKQPGEGDVAKRVTSGRRRRGTEAFHCPPCRASARPTG